MVLVKVSSLVVCLALFGCRSGIEERSQSIDFMDAAGSGAGPADASIADAVTSDACPTCSGDAGTCPDCDQYSIPPSEGAELVAKDPLTSGAVQTEGNSEENSNPTNGCRQNLPQLPAGCVVHRGNGRWLHCWSGGYSTPFGCLYASGVGTSCPLTTAQINTVSGNCTQQSVSARLLCVIDGIRTAIGGGWGTGGAICGHFARCFKRVWEQMGNSQTYTSRHFGFPPASHAFNMVTSTDPAGTYYVDAGNNILVWCPS